MNPTKETLIDYNHHQEKTLNEIGELLSLHPKTISKLFKQYAIPIKKYYKTKRRNIEPTRQEFIRDYLDDYLPMSELYIKWNFSDESFNRILTKFNIPRRKRIAHNQTNPVLYDKEKLEILFNDKTKSIGDIAKELNLSTPTVKKLLIHHGIIEDNCSITLARYGTISTYGTPPQVLKSIQTCRLKYNSDRPKTFKHRSKVEKSVETWLREEFPHIELLICDRNILNNKEIDIYIPDYNLGIEINGTYTHSEQARSSTKTDHVWKFKQCEQQGIQLISCWDWEWFNRNEIVKSIIRCKLNTFNQTFYARKCELTLINSIDAKQFYEENHIGGSTSYLGMVFNSALVYNNELIGVMSFGYHPRNNKTMILSRFAYKLNCRILGGKERLFSLFKKQFNVPLLSWSDNRWFKGDMYSSLGFELTKELKPDYCYYRSDVGLMNKQSLKKGKLLKMGGIGNTEKELADSLKFLKLWDCGKKTWVLNNV